MFGRGRLPVDLKEVNLGDYGIKEAQNVVLLNFNREKPDVLISGKQIHFLREKELRLKVDSSPMSFSDQLD